MLQQGWIIKRQYTIILIKGNLFKDIGGTAILAGVFSDEATEIHLPYNPKDEREVCNDMIISNNLITDVTNEDWGCVGIGAGYVRNISIEHNEIAECFLYRHQHGMGLDENAPMQ